MDRLTKLFKAGRYGLVKVKDNEQEVDSPYPNTLRAILESFQQLGAYEDTGLMPNEVTAMIAENARLCAEPGAAKGRWEEEASDGTEYTLTHFDGIYTVADKDGHVLCEFLRDPCAPSPSDGERGGGEG